jgi:hypothetical protein
MRREVALPPSDVTALEALGLDWETVVAAGANWLFVLRWPIPTGYNVTVATLGVRLAAYPAGVLDMVYFNPPLARADGKPIVGLSPTMVDGRPFQQWSRHYPWTAGIDNLARHLRRAGAWLHQELGKR